MLMKTCWSASSVAPSAVNARPHRTLTSSVALRGTPLQFNAGDYYSAASLSSPKCVLRSFLRCVRGWDWIMRCLHWCVLTTWLGFSNTNNVSEWNECSGSSSCQGALRLPSKRKNVVQVSAAVKEMTGSLMRGEGLRFAVVRSLFLHWAEISITIALNKHIIT